MNRYLLAVASILLVILTLARPAPCWSAGSGDISGDGLLNLTDANLLRDYLLGDATLTSTQISSADMSGDSKLDVADLVQIVNNIKGTITIDVTPDTGTWTLTGPAGFTTINGAGDRLGANTIVTAKPGAYTLHCKTLSGYTPPADQVKTLPRGGAIAFSAKFSEVAEQTVTITLPGGVPLVLIKCPAGSFQMGSPDTERGRYKTEGPVHKVTFSQPFYMGKYEVTQAQWKAVMGNNPAKDSGVGDNYPVYYVSWNDVAGIGGFIQNLNAHLSSTGQGGPVRLPSEAEWEYACRAGTTTRFYFGDSLTPANDYDTDGPTDSSAYPGKRSDYMWWKFNCHGNSDGVYGSKPVGTKLPNAWGLYDMAGNEWEFCQDLWHADYTDAPTDGSAWVDGGGTNRIIRGGGWDFWAYGARSACRSGGGREPNYSIGFRLARTN